MKPRIAHSVAVGLRFSGLWFRKGIAPLVSVAVLMLACACQTETSRPSSSFSRSGLNRSDGSADIHGRCALSAADWADIQSGAHQVESVSVSYADLSQQDMAEISRIPGLEQVSFAACRIPHAGIKVLGQVASLRELQIAFSDVSGTDFGEELRELRNLHSLFLNGPVVMDRDLRGVFRQESLSYLFLGDSTITGDCFAGLEALTRPFHLYLEGCQWLRDSAVDGLARAKLANPEFYVTLVECSITEKDLEKRMEELRLLRNSQ